MIYYFYLSVRKKVAQITWAPNDPPLVRAGTRGKTLILLLGTFTHAARSVPQSTVG